MKEQVDLTLEQARNNAILLSAYESFYNCVVVDQNGRIVFMSQHYAKLLGLDKAKVIGKLITEIIPGTEMMEILKTGRVDIGSLMTLYDHQHKTEGIYICNRRPIYHEGKIIGAFAENVYTSFKDFQVLQQKIQALQERTVTYKAKLADLEEQNDPGSMIVGHSLAIREVKQLISDYAASNLAVLITGETGTGKEVFAKAIHWCSTRRMENYIKINCAAIPKELIESELFGYEEGAFTGARKGGKPGKFLLADKGTILLDEIGELPLSVQAKLLRALQEKEVEPVGATKPVPVNVRLICSTNRDLQEMVEQGLFREDLYYRVNIVEVHIPPLRDRWEDIPELAKHFIEQQNQENGFAITGLSPKALALLNSYQWPGNVRELEHAIQRACVLARSGALEQRHFDFMRQRMEQSTECSVRKGLRGQKDTFERDAVLKALEASGGNRTLAARLLAIDRTVLYQKMKKYGIH